MIVLFKCHMKCSTSQKTHSPLFSVLCYFLFCFFFHSLCAFHSVSFSCVLKVGTRYEHIEYQAYAVVFEPSVEYREYVVLFGLICSNERERKKPLKVVPMQVHGLHKLRKISLHRTVNSISWLIHLSRQNSAPIY